MSIEQCSIQPCVIRATSHRHWLKDAARWMSISSRGGHWHGDNTFVIIVIMIRTQISLSEEEYNSAKAEAARLGISLAEFLRRSLRHVLPADEKRPWMRYAGMIETGERDASQKIDEVVYSQKK